MEHCWVRHATKVSYHGCGWRISFTARIKLAAPIEKAPFSRPICPVYQNVDALPHIDPVEIKDILLKQLTAPVRWKQSVINMIGDGIAEFVECDPGTVLMVVDGENNIIMVSG